MNFRNGLFLRPLRRLRTPFNFMKDKTNRRVMKNFPKVPSRWFASDNHASVHPLILEAIESANAGHAYAYGADPWTAKAEKDFKKLFGARSETFFVFNGTAANVLGLRSFLKPFEAVFCTESAHVAVDECGAFEGTTGSKLLTIPESAEKHLRGKINLSLIELFSVKHGDQHHVQPKGITITQSTEWGTLYSRDELKEIKKLKKKHHYFLHMDGARFANACVALGMDAKEMVEVAGVDVLSFGAAKNGVLFGEAVVFLSEPEAQHFKYIRKQGMQLNSRMRYMSAQFSAYLKNDLWLNNARHANQKTQYLAKLLKNKKNISLVQNPEVNALFIQVPKSMNKKLLDHFYFYIWDFEKNILRIMTSWDTSDSELKSFAALFDSF
jgi:threonine aldolase